MARSALLNVMVQAAFKASRSLARDFGEVQNLQVSLKGPGNFAGQAGRKAEEIIGSELMRVRPTYGLLGIGAEEIKGSDGAHRWIVDALDGATNFTHGVPAFAVSIALERNGDIVASVVLNPATDELYTAERGGGAFMNDRRLRVAARRMLSETVIGCAIPHLGHGHHGKFLLELRHVMGETAGLRTPGAVSLSLAYVAAGRLDGAWEKPVLPRSMAAGLLLVREAGGFVSDIEGHGRMFDTGTVIAGNEHIQKALVELVNRQLPET